MTNQNYHNQIHIHPDKSIDLTIITPIYNRRHTIEKLYTSLLEQSVDSFQWLIIDDGSEDGTEGWVYSLLKQNCEKINFRIDYYRKSNGGKHTALNYSHTFIDGKWVTIVDSDDFLTNNAVEVIISKWKKYEKDPGIGGITFQRQNGTEKEEAIDKSISGEVISSFVEQTNHGMKGDHCETFKTSVFTSRKFPEYEDERFVAEGAMWYLLTKDYNVVYSDSIIYICDYLDGGLTKSGRSMRVKNPKGGMWHAYPFMDKEFNTKTRLKNALLYNTYANFTDQKRKITKENYSVILTTMIPSLILYIYWKNKYIS